MTLHPEYGSMDTIENWLRRDDPLWQTMLQDRSFMRGSAKDTYTNMGRMGMYQFSRLDAEPSMDAEIRRCIAMGL